MTSSEPRPPPENQENRGAKPAFPIVGVGASAGGLEAFSHLLESIPERTGLAYVLVQHLDPHHTSQLSELLARSAKIPVLEATNGLGIRSDHAYVIPPNSYLAIEQGRLVVTPRGEARAPHLAVDHFFRSLAKEQGPRAIAVVLSGSGSDGTLGIAEIKAAGGITFAQDEGSARHSGMPRSAVESGYVDFILPPDQIAQRLAEIGGHPYLAAPEHELEDDHEQFRRVLRSVRGVTGVDFELYRDTTIKRRIARRMALHGMTGGLKRYADLLAQDRSETESLYRDMLITVTSFFRDPELFRLLKERVFPEILRSKAAKLPVRVWVPGCSTGQEAYSIAMSLLEFFDEQQHRREVQVFATDLSDPTALDKARAGVYPETIEAELTPERLRRFFRKEDHVYRIEKSIRDLCIFARQNIATDPPFSHMDLISCRNVLIYMSPTLQKQVLPVFHYALQTPGFLVLGSSETVGQNADLFDLVDRTNRIYAKKPGASRVSLHFAQPHLGAHTARVAREQSVASAPVNYQKEADRLAVGRYVPPGVLVDEKFEILQFRGETGSFLQPPPGDPTLGVLKMAREGLFLELRNGLLDAKRTAQPVVRHGVHVVDRDSIREISVRILPVRPPGAEEHCYLVLFEEAPAGRSDGAPAQTALSPEAPTERKGGLLGRLFARPAEPEPDAEPGPRPLIAADQQELARLRHEFAATKEYLQSLSEQQDGANEELRSANEEILSSNEELQSTNEELETAKEELQSSNEELTTVNEQLQHRNLELNIVGSDLSNLLSSTGIPVVMVGSDLRIRRVTAAARKILNMLPTDVGRPIGEIRPSLTTVSSLDPLIATVMEQMQPFEREVQDNEGTWWLLRIFPYRTQDRIDGAVVVLIDVDALKRAQGGLREALDYSSAIVETTHEPLLVLDSELRVARANRAFREKFNLDAAAIEGRSINEIEGGRWNISALADLLRRVTSERRNVEDFSIEHEFKGLGKRSLMFNARLIDQVETEPLVLLAIEDITERKQRLESLASAVRARDDFLAVLSHELRSPLAAIDAAAHVLRPSIDQSPSARATLEALERQLAQLRRLVEDLLDVSRLAHGKITLRTEPLELTSAVEQAIDSARALAEARAHEIAVRLPKEEVWIEADRVRLDQILQNLLSNAIKFSDAGGKILVSVDLKAVDDGSEHAVLKVADNGNGIPPEVLGRVFDAFTQGDNAGTYGRSGLGLGLSLVKRLVELHDGRVEAISDKARPGTEIVVRLPAIETPVQSAVPTVDGDAPTRSSVRRRILIVEDNTDAASTMATLLEMMGHEVQVVHDGTSALAAVADGQRPDIAIVDVGLPDMSGYDLARAIRALPAVNGLTLIAHTGYGQDADRERARQAGFDHHMVKPIDWKALERVLEDGEGEKERERERERERESPRTRLTRRSSGRASRD